jgi:hypothetical protein
VGNILRRHDIAPAPKRSQTTTWKEFIRRHMDVLAGADFFTVEVLTWRGLLTYYVLFFLHLETRRVSLTGITRHPTEEWMTHHDAHGSLVVFDAVRKDFVLSSTPSAVITWPPLDETTMKRNSLDGVT